MQRVYFYVLICLILSAAGCKPRYGSSLAETDSRRDEQFKVLSKVELMKSIVANGGIPTNQHDMFNEMLDVAVKSNDDEVRQHVVAALAAVLDFLEFEKFEIGPTQNDKITHSLNVGDKYGKGELLSYLALRNSESTCAAQTQREPKYCFDYVSCLNVMDHVQPFLTYQPKLFTAEVDAVVKEIGEDIACLQDSLRKDITLYRHKSLVAWVDFYRYTNYGTATDGELPTAQVQNIQIGGLQDRLEKLMEEATHPEAMMVRRLMPEELDPTTLWGLAQERGAELGITYGEGFKIPSLATLDQADFETQRTVMGTVKKFNDYMTGAYISNMAMYHLLDRLGQIDPTPWLKKISDLSYNWTGAYARNEEPQGDFLYPKVAFKALHMFSSNEMRLPWAEAWHQVMRNVFNGHIPKEKKERALYAALLGAGEQRTLANTLVQRQLVGIGEGAEQLTIHQKKMALEIRGFHSLFYMLGQFADAIDEYNRAEKAYKDARSKLSPEERGDRHHMINQAMMAAGQKYQKIWLSYACLNHKYGTGKEIITLDSYKMQQQIEIGCWENAGFDWYMFAREPHEGVRPFKCITDEGRISLPQVCGISRSSTNFTLDQIYNSVGQCFQQQDNFRWCQGNSAAVAMRLADISSFVAAAAVAWFAGPHAGYLTRSVLIALTVTAVRRAVLSVNGLRPFRDESKSWSDDWGKELALTTGMVLFIQPLIAANASLAGLSSSGGAGSSSVLAGGMRFVGFHGLNVVTFTGVSYVTPHIAAQLYGKSPAEMGADIPFSERIWDVVLFETLFAGFHGGRLGLVHRAAVKRYVVETATSLRSRLAGQGKKLPGITGPVAELNNPVLQGMVEYYQKNNSLNFDLYASLGRGGGKRATRQDLQRILENPPANMPPEIVQKAKALVQDDRAFSIYQSMHSNVYRQLAIKTGQTPAPDFYATVNTVLQQNGKQVLSPNGGALTKTQVSEITGLLKSHLQSLQNRRVTPEGRTNDTTRKLLDADIAATTEALQKLPQLTNASYKYRFDQEHLSQPAGDLGSTGKSLFDQVLGKPIGGGTP